MIPTEKTYYITNPYDEERIRSFEVPKCGREKRREKRAKLRKRQ